MFIEVTAWRDLVKTKVSEISYKEIAKRENRNYIAAIEQQATTANAATTPKTNEEYRKYAKAVTGIKVEATDASAIATAAKGWLTSDALST